jgi:hypothetical protein
MGYQITVTGSRNLPKNRGIVAVDFDLKQVMKKVSAIRDEAF